MNQAAPDGRDLVREKYALAHADYDAPRLVNRRGRALSDHDARLFSELYGSIDTGPDSRILEVAAGTGRFTVEALEHDGRIVATDVNETLLEGLRERVRNVAGERLVVAHEDAFALSFPSESFDVVYAMHFIPRLVASSDQASAIREMGRVLRPGGSLLINLRNARSWLYGPLYRRHAITTADAEKMLRGAGLEASTWRGKHVLTRRLLDRLPVAMIRPLQRLEWRFRSSGVDRAWDVFVLARKPRPG